MEFVRFSPMATPVKLENVTGLFNGYKINEVVHGGRTVNLRKQNYYYIPFCKKVVSYRATTAKEMLLTKERKFNFRETIEGGYGKTYKVDAEEFFRSAAVQFN